MDELQKHYADQKKLAAKDHKLYESMYVKCLVKTKLRDRKQNSGCLELGADMD